MSTKNTPETFWARVNIGAIDSCWEWSGALTSSGYGNLRYAGKSIQAHRLAYALSIGGITLATGFREVGKAKRYARFVLHRCDNRKCCNPSHLFLGSMRTNQLDAYAKGRKVQPKSEHSNAKLTSEQVRRIRKTYDSGGVKQTELAEAYGVSQRTISLVVRRETYKDIIC